MRRGTWILALSGMMALHQSGFAADPSADQPTGRSSGVKKTDAKARNYYKDLFGEDAPASAPEPKKVAPTFSSQAFSSDWDLEPQPEKSKAAAKPIAAAKSTAKVESNEPSFTDLPTAQKRNAAGVTAKPKLRVSQATYDRQPGKKQPIQQVRSSAPSIDEPVDIGHTPTKTAAAREEFSHEAPSAPIATSQAGQQPAQVTVEWVKKSEFDVGQECQVEMIVKNCGSSPASQVAIDAYFPTNVRLVSAEPRPASATDHLTWTFEQLPAASEQRIAVKMIPSRRGEIAASAQVRFTGTSSANFSVQEPLLKVAVKSSSKEVMLGDPAPQTITVTNPGTGTAHNVKIEAKLSGGLEHATREDHLEINVGSVGPGETRTYRLGLTAAKGGRQGVNVTATSSSEASSTDEIEFNVVAPSMKVAVEGPSLRYKGRNAKYILTVTNDGTLTNNNINVSQTVAEGFKFVSADHNGKFDASAKSVQWFIGRLEPGESTHVSCELNSLQIGEFAHQIHVTSDSGVQSDARIETRVDGIASLTMELVDLDDPVETGSETAYEIRIKNDGSKAAASVSVACELPAGMELLNVKAPVEKILEGRILSFNTIEQIAPGSQVTIRIHTKVIRDGNHRLKVRMTGGGLQEATQLEEVTRAYSDGSK